jgi:UDP-GlcNAc:undecaprenyl-phosphate/decaprenyl-phosphate GlcNAc-1-phosphate transferase
MPALSAGQPYTILAIVCIVPLLLSGLMTALLIRWAPRLGLVDYPAARKVHTRPTPKGGGLAIYFAVVIAIALTAFVQQWPILLYLGLGTLIVIVGLLDDLRPMPWQLRLLSQFAVAGVAVFLRIGPDWLLRLVALFWIVGLINAFNMLDNMDALSGGVAWVASGFLALAWLTGGQSGEHAIPYIVLLSAITGFLWFNLPPARIFMGDAGSTFLGYFLGLGSVEVALDVRPVPWGWAAPLCMLAVPWYDLISVVTVRLSQGRSPFHADKQHLSHRLVERGWSSPEAVRIIHLLALATGAAGLSLYFVSGQAAIVIAAAVIIGWCSLAVREYLVRRAVASKAVVPQESK